MQTHVNDHNTLFTNTHPVKHLAMVFQVFNGIINDDCSRTSKLCELAKVKVDTVSKDTQAMHRHYRR